MDENIRSVLSVITRASDETTSNEFASFNDSGCKVWALSKNADFDRYRSDLLKFIKIDFPGSRIIQVVGDSTPFSQEGSRRAKEYLRSRFESNDRPVFLWGYTGHRGPGTDINQIMNELIDEDPDSRSPRCFANIVDLGTARALKEWACRIPMKPSTRRNFIIVTGDANFGDVRTFDTDAAELPKTVRDRLARLAPLVSHLVKHI